MSLATNLTVGEISMFAGNYAPRGWALCNGQILQISQYEQLFSVIGTIYGGDGRTSFALPDLRSRVPVHFGTGLGLPHIPQGAQFGEIDATLNSSNVPLHTHNATATTITNVAVDTNVTTTTQVAVSTAAINLDAEVKVPVLNDSADSLTAEPNSVLANGEVDVNGNLLKIFNNSEDPDASLKPFTAPVNGTIDLSATATPASTATSTATATSATTVNINGGGVPTPNPFSVMQPSLGICFVISLQGQYPSRT